MATTQPTHMVKLGGSLLEDPDLSAMLGRLSRWLAARRRAVPGLRLVMVVGGGAAADVVRAVDRARPMDEAAAHWLAIRAMQFNAHCVAAALADQGPRLVRGLADVHAAGPDELVVVEPWEWLRHEESIGVRIPHRWTFTSDSIAAHVAIRLGAARLTLLKSALPPAGCDVAAAAQAGLVDKNLVDAARGVASIDVVNLRGDESEPGVFPTCALR